MTDVLLREDSGGLCTLTLNRPEKLNALNTAIFERLDQELAVLETQSQTIGCVVLRATGRYFCAGADLAAVSSVETSASPPPAFKPGVIERMSRLPQPVIACVHATCITGGLELVLGADLIIASASARFADTHGRWGLVAGWGMSQRLPRRIGASYAKLLMMTGRFVDSAEALRIGLIDLCVPDEKLDDEVSTLAREILTNSWHTNCATKRILIDTEGMRLSEGLAHEQYHYPGLAPDYKERLATFSLRR
jgi:enoyl-CoA hydratase/carnithine racemase